MNKLLATPSEINEKAKEITALKENMQTHLEYIRAEIIRLTESTWVSAASTSYQNQFTHLYNQAIDSLDTLQQHANNLSKAAETYANMESEQTAQMESLEAKDIF